jgi:fucose permease
MFIFGIVMALLGAIMPSLSARLHFEAADIGALFLAMNGAMLASSLVLGLVMDRFGMKLPLAAGPLLVAATLLMITGAATFSSLLPALVLLGIGGAALNGATNTLTADLHTDARRKSAALNRLGVFFGFGALFLPFVMGALLAWYSLQTILGATAALCVAAGVSAALLRFPAPKQRNALPVAAMPAFLRSPLVLIFALLLFLESGVEFALGGFISMYLTRDMAIASVSKASWILAGYWASIMTSRAVLSRISLGIDPYRILLLCACGACAGAVLAGVAPAPSMAALAIVLCGCSLAGIYPTALGIAGDRFQSHSGTVFGILFTVALAGGMLLPWAAGQIGSAVGLRWAFGMIAAAFAAIAGLSHAARAGFRKA